MGNKSSVDSSSNTILEQPYLANNPSELSDSSIIGITKGEIVIEGVSHGQQKKPSRRIVKASTPKKVDPNNIVDSNQINNSSTVKSSTSSYSDEFHFQEPDEDDCGFEKVIYGRISSVRSPSDAVARELEREKTEKMKVFLRQTANERHRTKRETEIKNRREKQMISETLQHDNVELKSSFTSESSSRGVKANPMSRFLPAFSVEEHPEHKRSLATTRILPTASSDNNDHLILQSKNSADSTSLNIDQDVVNGPFGKKRRQSSSSEIYDKSISVCKSNKGSENEEIKNAADSEWWENLMLMCAISVGVVFVLSSQLQLQQRHSIRKI